MTLATQIFAPTTTFVAVGGTAQIVIFGPCIGGLITNPDNAPDQEIASAEPLYLSLVGDAELAENNTTFALDPGESFYLPANFAGNATVNAATSGHAFSGYVVRSTVQFPPTPTPGPFPPAGPVTLLQTIPAYLYQQYNDDADLQAYIKVFNELVQGYVDWFNDTELPVYTRSQIHGALLDFVAEGLYGLKRPTIQSGKNTDLGPLNTYVANRLTPNGGVRIGNQDIAATSDDIFKRILTWHLYKGDGKVFDINWLKRRIVRFLLGKNGTDPPVTNTYGVSVTFSPPNSVNINLISGYRTITGGAIPNRCGINAVVPNQINSIFTPAVKFADALIFAQALLSGALEVPFQFVYTVSVE